MDASQAYVIPLHNPLFRPRATQQVMWWRGIVLDCRAEPDRLERYIPPSLSLVDGRVQVLTYEYAIAGLTAPVCGGGIYLHAQFHDAAGYYPVIAFASTDVVVCANREELGEPAILCDPAAVPFEFEANTAVATLRRRGDILMSLSVGLERDVPPAERWGEDVPVLHYKKIPNGDPTGTPLREIVKIRREWEPDGKVVASYAGPGSVRLGVSTWDFHQLAPLEVVGARYLHLIGGYREIVSVLWRSV